MKKAKTVFTLILFILMTNQSDAQKKNLVSANCNGSELVSASSNSDGGGYGAQNLLSSAETESQPHNGTAWWTDQGTTFPHSAVLKMCGNGGTISKFVISNHSPEDDEGGGYRGIPAKEISVEVSSTGADKGFKKVGDFVLKRNKSKQSFPITPTEAKWIRITVKSNYGHSDYTVLGAFEAY